MATKEENQLLINEFVTRNASTISNLESAKQKAVLDAIILIQNKFGTINQTTFKNDVKPKPKRVVNQQVTSSSSTTTTTTKLPIQVASTINATQQEEIRDLEEAIDTQKLLLTLADTKEEKEEIKSLLKDLRGQLKKLKK
jgi:hypothetical protein